LIGESRAMEHVVPNTDNDNGLQGQIPTSMGYLNSKSGEQLTGGGRAV
jgi:hypothetical protein